MPRVRVVNADPATFETIDPAAVGNSRDVLVSELSGKGTVVAHAGGALDDATASRVVERGEGARAPRLPVRGGRRLLRPAHPARRPATTSRCSGLESWRVISEKREDGRVQTEATIKIWGRRSALRARGRGQRPGQRARHRPAVGRSASATRTCATSSSSTTRCASSTSGKPPARPPACCSTPPTARNTWGAIGVHENLIEASWDALVDSLEAGMVRTRAPAGVTAATDVIPLARPVLGDAEGAP